MLDSLLRPAINIRPERSDHTCTAQLAQDRCECHQDITFRGVMSCDQILSQCVPVFDLSAILDLVFRFNFNNHFLPSSF